MTNRSFRSLKWGEVYRPLRTPAAINAACAIAVTEPLPLVPATCRDVKLRSG